MKKLIFSLLLCGCADNHHGISEATKIENISEYEYDRIQGHNAAVEQFCPENKSMLVDLSSKKVVTYVNKNENVETNGYADGYHNALELIFRPRTCPR